MRRRATNLEEKGKLIRDGEIRDSGWEIWNGKNEERAQGTVEVIVALCFIDALLGLNFLRSTILDR